MKQNPMRLDIDETKVDDSKSDSRTLTKIIQEKETKIKKGVKKGLLLFSLFVSIVIVGLIYDFTTTLSSMLINSPILGVVYLVLVLLFVGTFGYIMLGEYRGFKKIKEIEGLQEEADSHIKNPSKASINFFKNLTKSYLSHQYEDVASDAKTLYKEFDTMLDSEVAESFEEKILQKLDTLARDKITKYSTQTAISTAISPVAFIDALLIISRSHIMVTEIAKIYGYKPNFLGRLSLYKRVFGILAFASVTDILANHSHDLLGNSFLSKLSMHSAQGVANGILVARVGLSTIKACRPLSYNKKGEGFLGNLSKSIAKKLFSRE